MNVWRVLLRATEPVPAIGGGLAAGAALALGAPLLAVPVVGVGALAAIAYARAADDESRRSRRASAGRPRVELAPTWQVHVDEAIDSHRRYVGVAATIGDDTLRTELDSIGRRLEEGIDTMRQVAERGQQLDHAVEAMPDPAALRQRLKMLREQGIGHDDARWTSVAYQLDATEKVRTQRREVLARLDTLDAQLDAAVVQAIETGLAADRSSVRAVGDAVESALADLDSLNRALTEIGEVA